MHTNISLFSLLFICSCTYHNEENRSVEATMEDNEATAHITIIADLPDSLQPKIIFLENTPAVKTIFIQDKPVSFTIDQIAGQRNLKIEPTKKLKAAFIPVMKNYTAEQGLAQDVTSWTITDNKGNLWFGTHVGGISRYDGHAFTNYTTSHGLIENRIVSMMEDKAGNIWVATSSGVSKFNGTTFSTFGNFKDVREILEDHDGNLWFATLNGLYKYASDSIVRYSESDGLTTNRVTSLKEDKNGILWVGTDNGLFKYDPRMPAGPNDTIGQARQTESFGQARQTESFGQANKFTKVPLNGTYILTVGTDRRGNIWAGTHEGYIKYDGENSISFPLRNAYFRHVYEDRLGNVWLGGNQEGIGYYDASSPSVIHQFYDLYSGATLTEDKSGNIWIGTSASGVIKYSGPALKQLTDASIRSVMEDKNGHIWFAGYGSINRFDGEYLTSFSLSTSIWSLFEDKSGNIWMGSGEAEGLIKLENNSLTFYSDLNGLVNNAPQFITQDSQGNLWIGTDKGLSKFDGKSFTNFTKQQGLAGDQVACIVEDQPGEFLIGTSGGLSIFDAGYHNAAGRGASFTNYAISQTPQGNDIRSIIKDADGNIWMGTYGGGITRYDGQSFYTYTIDHGLPDNVVTQVALTKEGNIIVGTNNGIAVLTGFKPGSDSEANTSNDQAATDHYAAQNNLSNKVLKNFTPVFEIYNPQTGYPVMDVNRGQHAIFEDSKGILWIASGSDKSGLMRFDYSSFYKNNHPPELNILSVKVNNELVSWHNLPYPENNQLKPTSKFETITVPASVTEEVTTFGKTLSQTQREEMRNKYKGIEFDGVSKFYPVPQNLKLPHKHNNVTIEFAAIEPDKPSLVKYQYMLEGYDKNWSTPANITSATYGNMYEGTYEFHLKAQSPSGIWSEPITYTFTVLPPWWRTWWAYAMYALFFLFSLSAFVKWREHNLQLEKLKLEKTVEIRTAELIIEKKKSDDLLLNILPEEVAEELKINGKAAAQHFDEVTVMFTDFKNFTQASEKLSPAELVDGIHNCYSEFDKIITKYNLEKIKTIGDSYMCAGGLPVPNKTNAEDTVNAAIEICEFINRENQKLFSEGKPFFEIRIGCHTGSVVAGIVGIKKFAYDIWGDTVNIASRMESSGETGRVNISGATYELVKDKFRCTHRGKISAKNKGEIDMYFVERLS